MEEVMIIGFQHNDESMQHILTVNFMHQGAMQATRIHSSKRSIQVKEVLFLYEWIR